jgi:very-short-patch-repair endonuclease
MRTQDFTLKRARRLRQALTGPEVGLWVRLRYRQLGGFRFRRQHPVGPYILDFYCAEARLAVEIDGPMHDDPDQIRRDARRDEWLAAAGIGVLHLPSSWVKDPNAVLRGIFDELQRNAPSGPLGHLPRGRGRTRAAAIPP